MLHHHRAILSATLAVIAFGCGGRPATLPGPSGLEAASLKVEVENQNFYDITVYAYNQGYHRRLGQVTGHTTKFFTFKWSQTDLRMLIDFVGAGQILSESMPVTPGLDDNLYLIVQPHDHLSSARIIR